MEELNAVVGELAQIEPPSTGPFLHGLKKIQVLTLERVRLTKFRLTQNDKAVIVTIQLSSCSQVFETILHA